MPDELLERLRRFHDHTFPGVQQQFQDLVTGGQHPTIQFIGCSDSRLVPYPMVREQVDAGRITLHGWHYVIEDGEVHVFDVKSGGFVAASSASHSGTGPYQPMEDAIDSPVFNEIDDSYGQGPSTKSAESTAT